MLVRDLFERRVEPLSAKLLAHAHDPNVYVTFVDMLKLGIHPNSEWDDPVGVYFYPVKELMSGKASNNNKFVPFASERRYAYIVRATGNMLELQDYSTDELDRDIDKMVGAFEGMLLADNPSMPDGDAVSMWEHMLMSWYERWAAHPGAAFWRVTERMANYIERRFPARSSRMLWHQLIRAAGYDGVVDRGQKIISPNEPAQAVILNVRSLTVLEAVNNDFAGSRDQR